jgi:hypothetical protein
MLDAYIIKRIINREKRKRRPSIPLYPPPIPIKEDQNHSPNENNRQEDEERGVVIIDMR